MTNALICAFRRLLGKRDDLADVHVYRQSEHRTWGNRIDWSDAPDSRGRGSMHGWLSRLPRKGDRIVCLMQSGRDAVFEVTKAEWMRDPRDMFLADVKFIGFEDEMA